MKTVILPASISSELNWRCQIDEMKALEEPFLISLDFGFGLSPFFLNDQTVFQTLILTIDQFSKEVWPLIKDRCRGLVLYQGPLHLLSGLTIAEGELTLVEAATVFGDYLHRLASFLPDEATPYCLFEHDASLTAGERAHLLSSERFAHLNLSLNPSNSAIGVLLPPDELCSVDIIQKLDQLLTQRIDLRVIPESRLNELWNGLDELIVIEGAISKQGRRQILGFEAAGGVVKKFGAEGFEPPTHCSQSSCASQTALCSERESSILA